MELNVDHSSRLVTVWLQHAESGIENLGPLYEKYRNTPYRVVVMRSGAGDLLADTSALLRLNRR